MKKIISLILILTMTFSLIACSSEPVSIEEEEGVSSREFSLGQTTNSTYRSDFIGLSVKIPDGWRFYSDQEMLSVNNIPKEFYDKQALDALANADTVYDMIALNEDDGSSINVILDKLNVRDIATFDYAEIAKERIETLRVVYEGYQFEDLEITHETVVVDGCELNAVVLSGAYYEFEFYLTTLMLRRGNYFVSISVGAYGEKNLDKILDGFKFDK